MFEPSTKTKIDWMKYPDADWVFSCQDGLGDCWAACNALATLAYTKWSTKPIRFSPPAERRCLCYEIFGVLGVPISMHPHWTYQEPNKVLSSKWTTTLSYWYTRRRWEDKGQKRIVYHYDGVQWGDRKNPKPHDLPQLVDFVPGYEFVPCRRDWTIEQCVEQMATASLFLGIDSGFSHIAHSVGVPVFLIQYGIGVHHFHKGKDYCLCKRTAGALRRVREFCNA